MITRQTEYGTFSISVGVTSRKVVAQKKDKNGKLIGEVKLCKGEITWLKTHIFKNGTKNVTGEDKNMELSFGDEKGNESGKFTLEEVIDMVDFYDNNKKYIS